MTSPGVWDLVRHLVTSSDIQNGKPHPEPYLKAASGLGFPAPDCVVCEDVPAGIQSGRSAGAKVIAFRTTVEERVLREAGADWIMNNCLDIRLAETNNGLLLTLAG